MKRTRFLGAALVLLGVLSLGKAFAFVTLGSTWTRASLPVHFFTNPNGTPPGWEAAVLAGARAWNNVPNQYFRFAWSGQTGRMAEDVDGVNVVSNAYNPAQYQRGVLAVTYGWGGANYTEFGTAFIQTMPFSTDDTPGTIDVQSVATHELGHALGLGHSALPNATMYYATGPNELWRRNLSADDQQGEQFLYPGGGAAPNLVNVSGTVREANGQGAANVVITASINGLRAQAITGASGTYRFTRVPQGTLNLVPGRANTTFTPGARNVQVGNANIVGQDFTVVAAAARVTVSGRVTDAAGRGLPNVVVHAAINGLRGWFVTDATGNYWFLRVPQGTITLWPTRAGLTFAPQFRQFHVGANNIVGQNFVGR